MILKNELIKAYIKLKKIEVCRVLTEEEKQAMIPGMIEANRRMDRDITTCRRRFTKGLELKPVELESCGAWSIVRKGNPADKIIYYIHGGGFTGACTRERMRFVSYMAEKFKYNVFSIDYRLAPEFKLPTALYDCLDGYEYLLDRYDAKNIFLIGESAGGNLVLTLSMLLRDRKLPLPCGVYSNSPVTQLIDYTESYDRCSLNTDFIITRSIIENTQGICCEKEETTNPYISPLFGDMTGLPPITLTASRCECLYDDSVMMYEKLRDAGNDAALIPYDDMCHAFIISPQMRRVVRKAYPDLKRIIYNSFNG